MSIFNLTLSSTPNQIGTFDCQVDAMKVYKQPTDDYDVLRRVDMGGSTTPFMVAYNVEATPSDFGVGSSLSIFNASNYASNIWVAICTGFNNTSIPNTGYQDCQNYHPRGPIYDPPILPSATLGSYYIMSYEYPEAIAQDYHWGMFIKKSMIENDPGAYWYTGFT